MEPKRVLQGTKMVLPETKNGSSNGSHMGTAEEPFNILDSIFFVVITMNSLFRLSDRFNSSPPPFIQYERIYQTLPDLSSTFAKDFDGTIKSSRELRAP